MGLLRGRHAQVMSRRELARARQEGRLPDVYIRSAEYQVDVDDEDFRALLDTTTGLPADARRRIEIEEGLIPPD
jgi:hypothetical protein